MLKLSPSKQSTGRQSTGGPSTSNETDQGNMFQVDHPAQVDDPHMSHLPTMVLVREINDPEAGSAVVKVVNLMQTLWLKSLYTPPIYIPVN